MKDMRDSFSRALVAAASRDPRVMLLTGDHGYALFDDFRKAFPDRYLNVGVAEQNMVGVAAGMAKGGFYPAFYGLSAFVPVRTLEQIKLDFCYENLPCVMIGDGAGLVYSALGTSHQSTEDIAALRAIPQVRILSPADGFEMEQAMALAFSADCPVYLRMGKSDVPAVHEEVPDFSWGDLVQLREGSGGFAFLATGSMVRSALDEAESWPDSSVWSVPSLKPINAEQVVEICRGHKAIITIEEHSVLGGLGSIICEIAAAHAPTWICRIGIEDRFSQFCGSWNYLRIEHQIDPHSIADKVSRFAATVGAGLSHALV